MTHAPIATSSRHYDDPLDDVVIAPERAFYHKVTAAHEYLLLSRSPPEEVFQMCGLTEEDLRRFYRTYPDYAKKFKAAYQAAFSFGPV